MIVYLLTMSAVYDHGSAGIFTTRETAEEHARALDARSDGHHDWRINEMLLDEPVEPDATFGNPARRRYPDITLEFVPRSNNGTR